MSRTYRKFPYWDYYYINNIININIKQYKFSMDRNKYKYKKVYRNIDNNKRRTEDREIINNYLKEYNEDE